MITFVIPGPPRGKGRPRFSRKSGTTYTDQATAAYENLVALACREAMKGAQPYAGAISLGVVTYMPIPASASQKKRIAMAGTNHIKKPDVDNVLKAVLDGLNGIAFHDDAQVARLHACKLYSSEPRVEVTVVEIAE